VVVPKKNGKLKICVDFKKLDATTKKDLYPLPFIDKVLNILTWHDVYSLDGYFGYHEVFITLEDIQNNLCNILGSFQLGSNVF
jgi:hypothetical protein